MNPKEYLERLIENSTEKYIITTEILRITKAQNESMTEDEMDALEGFIDDKQILIDRMNKLDEDFEVYFKRIKSTMGIKSLEELTAAVLQKYLVNGKTPLTNMEVVQSIENARKLKSTITDVIEMIKQIAALEEENKIKANALLESFAAEVRKANQGKHAKSAYTPGGGYVKPPSYFFDSKK